MNEELSFLPTRRVYLQQVVRSIGDNKRNACERKYNISQAGPGR
jgi:hypothetical protein